MSDLRVVVCEDEGLTRLRLTASLTSHGFTVIALAANGREALKAVSELAPDVVLMDVEMPVMNGLEALAAIMRDHPTPVVMLTAYSDTETIRAVKAGGACGYLSKPIIDAQLGPEIQRAVRHFAESRRAALR